MTDHVFLQSSPNISQFFIVFGLKSRFDLNLFFVINSKLHNKFQNEIFKLAYRSLFSIGKIYTSMEKIEYIARCYAFVLLCI